MKRILNFIKSNKEYSIYLIVILGAIPRLYQIAKRDFWYDEAFTGVAIKESFNNMLRMIIQDVHPPLYYYSVKVFAHFFNYSVFGIRLFSALFGILSIWLVYLIAKELFGYRASIWASLITAISPFAIQYSQEARMYALLGFLLLAASYFFIRGLKTDRLYYYCLWGIFLGLSALTHYMGIVFAPFFFISFVYWKATSNDLLNKNLSLKSVSRFIKELLPNRGIFIGYIESFIVFSFWIPKFLNHLKADNLDWIKPADFSSIIVNIQIFLFGNPKGELSAGMPLPNEIYGISPNAIMIILTILFGILILSLMKYRKREVGLTIIFSLGFMLTVYLLSQLGMHYMVSRYLLPASYFIFILISIWLSRLKPLYLAFFTTLYIILIFCTVHLTNATGYNELAKNIDKYKNNNIYILNSFDYVIAKYYFGANKLTLYNIDWPQYDSSGWSAIGKSLKKTENYEDLKNDKNAIILYNKSVKPADRNDKSFNPLKYKLVDSYANIGLYKF
jgi:uncharacterized membrane protein